MIIPVVLHVSIKSIPELAMMSATYLSVSVSLCFFFGRGGRGGEGGSRKREWAAEVSQKYYQEIKLVHKYTFLG